jgi:DNA-binding LacI/PurR family transcriptional regulator
VIKTILQKRFCMSTANLRLPRTAGPVNRDPTAVTANYLLETNELAAVPGDQPSSIRVVEKHRKRVGIKDVAAAAGVSPTTVSDALSGKGRLPDSTRQHVQHHAHLLGYAPSSTARSLVAGRSGILLMSFGATADQVDESMWDVEFFVKVLLSASTVALDSGFALALAAAPGRRKVDFDGALVVDPLAGNAIVETALAEKKPLISIGRFDDISAGVVDNDFAAATTQLLELFKSRGAQRPALVASRSRASYETRTASAFRKWCKKNALAAEIVKTESQFAESSGRSAAAQLFTREKPSRPDAVLVTSDRLALGVLDGVRQLGLGVPEDVMIACLGDSASALHATVPLTAIDLRPDELGRVAAEQLVAAVTGGNSLGSCTISTRLIERRSTKRKRRSAAEAR